MSSFVSRAMEMQVFAQWLVGEVEGSLNPRWKPTLSLHAETGLP